MKVKQIPCISEWLEEAKKDSRADEVGMYLIHNGTVRKTAKAKVRFGQEHTKEVIGMLFSYDKEKVEQAIQETYQMEGIFYVRVWLNSGELKVGDDLMYVLIGGDIRPNVVNALESLVEKLKSSCVKETELFECETSKSLFQKENDKLNEIIYTEQKANIGCVIMASGMAKRFGTNKLLATFQGKTLIQRILDITGEDVFEKRVVVTRSEEVAMLCKQQKIDVIFHALPNRNDAVRLGIEAMKGMEACIFCPCDQPLLKKESLKQMVIKFRLLKKGMLRLSYQEKQGSPVLFGKEYFEELANLPEKSGGSYLIKKYPENVGFVLAIEEMELYDIDTKEDYEWLIENYEK